MALSNFISKPVKVPFLKTPVSNDCSVLFTFTSRKEIELFFSSSAVNLIVGCCLFKKSKNKIALSIDLKRLT